MRVYISKKYRLDKLLPLTHKEIIELSNKDKDVLKQCVGINNSTHKMFYNCLKLTEIPQLNISHVTDISYMFCRLGYNNPHSFYDKKFNKYVTVSNKDLPQIDTSNVVDMSYMFVFKMTFSLSLSLFFFFFCFFLILLKIEILWGAQAVIGQSFPTT